MPLASREREAATTMKCLRNYPADKLEMVPAEKSRKAKDLLALFAAEEPIMTQIAAGSVDWSTVKYPAVTSGEKATKLYEAAFRAAQESLRATSEADLNLEADFAPGFRLRWLDALWMMLMDQVHHRGQFTVYLRLAGVKVPQIYDPSADEPMPSA